jgi:hypothetical protein
MKISSISLFVFFVVFFFGSGCKDNQTMFIEHKTSRDIDAAPWGVEFNALPPHIDKYPHELTAFTKERLDSVISLGANLGIKWVRLSVNWSNVVDTAGIYHWEKVDQIINGLYENNIEIGLCITGGHKLYTQSIAPNTPEAIAHWKEYVTIFVNRYKDKISHWELWNEPNTPWFWKPYPKAADYVALMKEFHSVIKEIQPEARIAGGSLARLDMMFADTIFQLGIGDYINAVTYHPYSELPEAIIKPVKKSVKTPVWYADADHSIFKFREMIDSYNPEIALWQGECGYPSQDNGSGWMGLGPWSPTIQAKWLLRRMLVDLSYNAEVINYFCMVEYVTGGNVDMGTGTINSKGLLTLNDLSEKPAFLAMQNLTSSLNGNLNAGISDQYEADITDFGSFHNIRQKNILFLDVKNDRGEDYLAYWLNWRMQDQISEAQFNINTSRQFNDPVVINLLTGEVKRVNSKIQDGIQSLTQLPLADFPFILTEFSNIKLR